MSTPLIKTDRVGKIHRVGAVTVEALRDVTLEIYKGEFLSIIGPSGSGKSTLLNIWGMLDTATTGRCLFDGVDVAMLDSDARAAVRNKKIGFVFQNFNLLARSTAIENVALPLLYGGIDAGARHDRALAALKSVGMEHRQSHRPHQLSGGEQQRIAIARALINHPLLILADEPTGAIDRRNGMEVIRQLHHLNATGRTVVLITHDPDVACHAQRIVELEDGEVRSDTAVTGREKAIRRQREIVDAQIAEAQS